MPKFNAVLLTVLLLSYGTVPALAQQQTNAPSQNEIQEQLKKLNALANKVDKKLRSAQENGNVLTELEVLRSLYAEYSAKGPEIQEMMASLLMEKMVELGNYAEALEYADIGANKSGPGEPSAMSELENYEPIAALEAISSMAEDSQIILINEAHHVAQHRAFTHLMLKVLRPKGFTYFAAEALFEGDTLLNKRGYPIKSTGVYINEPIFGDLIRTALKLGYHVVPYEWASPGYDVDKRERGQAQNLVDRILKENPDARIVVHAGYSHINEAGTLAGAKTMAQRLKEMAGIDPLTIDQTMMSEHSALAYEHPLYRYVLNEKSISQPSFLRNAKNEWWTLEPGKWDVTLFHPRSVYEGGRPTWLRLGERRKPYKIPANICESATHCLVRVRVADEADDAVPVDQVEVTAGRDIPVLMLPPGEFVQEVKDATDKMLRTSRLKLP